MFRYPYTFDETISSSLPKFNIRSCLMTLFLILTVIALLSIAGLIIAIYSLVSNTRNSGIIIVAATTYSTTTTNNSATTTPLQCSSSPTTTYVYSTETPLQCINYTQIIDNTRNVAYTQSINSCDNKSPFTNTTSVWIRFLDPAGTLLANSPVPPNSCGAVATGWFAGQYPTAIFTTATSIVCYFYSTNTCSDCSLISVTKCQDFYVYQLPQPPACDYRYCTV
ncbi:hypothetical protein I4U23_020549 [Adineta vaga]|nr:hypothetical protein I4U23_020549 [Adineta vaga]